MKFSVQRESLLSPLTQIIGAVERRQTDAIFGNILIEAAESVTFTATDSEIELQAVADIHVDQPGSITVPARKFYDICRHLPDSARIDVSVEGEKAKIKSGRSRFTLTTLPADQFPKTEPLQDTQLVSLSVEELQNSIQATAFSMAQQDVRFYLNGLLLEISPKRLSCVATDGHRLAYAQCETKAEPENSVRAIVPRKSVSEWQRLLGTAEPDDQVSLHVTPQQLQISLNNVRLTTKLIDGSFPDYNRVIPTDSNKEIVIDCNTLKQALTRASVLSNEKYRGVRLALQQGVLTISTNNPEQEEARDEVEVDYTGESTEIGFNVQYLLDVLGAVDTENAVIRLKDGNSSALVTPEQDDNCQYVVMPMRL